MIVRCTAQFARAFDALQPHAQRAALEALKRFHLSPRVPTRDAYRVAGTREVWAWPFIDGFCLTYQVVADEQRDAFVCILRNIAARAAP